MAGAVTTGLRRNGCKGSGAGRKFNRELSRTDMEDIFSIQPSNAHQSLLLLDPAEWRGLSVRINRESLAAAWKPMAFNFKASDAKTPQLPTICTVYVPGVLAFRSDLQEQLFPGACGELEFLPKRLTVN
jgi:hypothetical protein